MDITLSCVDDTFKPNQIVGESKLPKNVDSEALLSDNLEQLKHDPNSFDLFCNNSSASKIVNVLEKLGRLSDDLIMPSLLKLLSHESEKVRIQAVKNLAKLVKIELLDNFQKLAFSDPSSEVRRETASAIGRLRNEIAIPVMIKLLEDADTKVAMQAIRGLIVFKKKPEVLAELKKLEFHPNDQIQDTIRQAISSTNKNISSGQLPHAHVHSQLRNVVVNADTLEAMSFIPEDSVHLTFTSPPYYNARDYSFYSSYQDYLNFMESVFRETHRVTKEGRFLLVNSSPVIVARVSRAHSSKRYPIPYDIHSLLTKIGWEFIDDIVWIKPEASAKNRIGGFMQHRKPLGYKPNAISEMIMVYRKKSDRLLDWNMKQYGEEVIASSLVKDPYESSNVWKIDPVFDKTHSAVFPIELCNKVIQYYSYEGDLVFDPFAGSGTLGKSALNLKRAFFLTEQDPKYFKRIQEVLGSESLFTLGSDSAKFLTVTEFKDTWSNNEANR